MAWLKLPLLRVGRKAASPQTVIQSLIKSLGLPAKREQGGIWTLLADVRDTYQVRLSIIPQDHRVFLMASSEACIERPLLTHEALTMLLEWNSNLENCSFRLVSIDDRRIIALVRTIDLRFSPEGLMVIAARGIIETMQLFICKAVAIGALVPGPHDAE